jgi:hypothetical protein
MLFILKLKNFVNHAGPSSNFGSLPTVKVGNFGHLTLNLGATPEAK